MTTDGVEIEVGGRTVRISNPGRVYFPARGETKLDLARYYLSVGDGIVRALRERPCMLHRFPSGVAGEKVHQKRVPGGAPPWLETVRLHFPRYGRYADELADGEQRQLGGDVLDEVALALLQGAVDDLVRELDQARLEVADGPRREGPLHDVAVLAVLRRVHVEHEHPGGGERLFLVLRRARAEKSTPLLALAMVEC